MGFADKGENGQPGQEVIGFGGQGTFDANQISPFRLVRDAYTGFGGFRDGSYLVRHKREMEFETRRGYSYYVNLFAPILDSLVDPVFERAPMRAGGGALWPEFLADCDRTGKSLTDFMKLAAFKSKRDGSAWIVVDNVAAPANTVGEAAAGRAFPYVYIKEASEVVYWKTGKSGALEEIAFAETVGSTEMGKDAPVQYRKWDSMGWTVYAKLENGELLEPVAGLSGVHGLGRLPVVPVYSNFLEVNSPVPHPPLYQIAVLNTAIYNLSSEIRSLQRSQGFSILVIPALNGKFPAGFTIGASNALAVPDTSKFLPQFVSPDVSVLAPYFDERKFLIESIYRQAKLAGVTGVVETSGVSKSWDFRATNVALAQLARAVEDAERHVCALFGLWQGSDSFELTVSYPEDFGVVDLDGEIKQAADFLALGYPPKVNTAVKARVLSYYFRSLSPDEIKDLAEAVEQASDDELQSGLDAAGDGLDGGDDPGGDAADVSASDLSAEGDTGDTGATGSAVSGSAVGSGKADQAGAPLQLVLIRGLPGSGKTTFAKKRFPGFVLCEADQFFTKNGVYKFDITRAGAAHKWCLDKARAALAAGKSAVVANTFVRNSEMKPFADLAAEFGAALKVHTMTGNFGSIHAVPAGTIEKMRAAFEDLDLAGAVEV